MWRRGLKHHLALQQFQAIAVYMSWLPNSGQQPNHCLCKCDVLRSKALHYRLCFAPMWLLYTSSRYLALPFSATLLGSGIGVEPGGRSKMKV